MSGVLQDPVTGSQDQRRINAYLRGPLSGAGAPSMPALARMALAVNESVRNGRAHAANLARIPAPTDAVTNSYGVQQSGGFAVDIVGNDLPIDSYSAETHWDGWSLRSIYGTSPTAFAHDRAYPIVDHEGVARLAAIDEMGFVGGRQVINIETEDTEGNPATATASGTTAPTVTKNVSYNGKACVSIAFASGVGTRAAASAQLGSSTVVSGQVYMASCQIALSRALTGSESIAITYDGAAAAPSANRIVLTSAVGTTAWQRFLVRAFAAGAGGTNRIYVDANGTLSSAVTVYIAERMIENSNGRGNQSAPSEYVRVDLASTWPHPSGIAHYASGVRGRVWLPYPNLNTVSASGVVTDAGHTAGHTVRMLYAPGRSGPLASIPSGATNSITGDIAMGACVALRSWNTGQYQGLIGKYNQSYGLFVGTTGKLELYYNSASAFAFSSVNPTTVPGQMLWVAVTRVASSGLVRFWTSTDPWWYSPSQVTWTQLGTDQSTTAGNINSSSVDVQVMSCNTNFYSAGFCSRAFLNNTTNLAAAPLCDVDFSVFLPGASSAVMPTGETVTLTGTGGNMIRAVERFAVDSTLRRCRHAPAETQQVTTDINGWTASSVSAAAATGPDWLQSGWALTDSNAAALGNMVSPTMTIANDSNPQSIMIRVRKETTLSSVNAGIQLALTGGTALTHRIHLDPRTGSFVAEAGLANGSATVDDADEWFWIVRIAITNNASGNTGKVITLYPSIGTVLGTSAVTTNGTTVFAWPMACASARCETYIPITGSSVTRAAQTITFPASLVNDAEGFAFCGVRHEIAPTADVNLLADSGSSRAVMIVPGASSKALGSRDGTNTANGSSAPSTALRRLAVAWSGSAQTLYVDGTAETAASYDGAWSIGTLVLGAGNAGDIGPLKIGSQRPPAAYLTACNAARDPFSRADFDWIRDNARGTVWELELVSELTRANLSTLELTDLRRATCKLVNVERNRLSLRFADIDTDALDRSWPANDYTKEIFTGIYAAHIGRAIPDLSPGTCEKVPCAFVETNGTSVWRFAICEARAGVTYTINTVYRDGRIVTASEYTVATTTYGAIDVRTITFSREQRDTNGRQYEFVADVSVSGNREPSREIQRLLTAVGINTDAASFTAAITEDAARGFYIDAVYAAKRQLRAIVEDLLQVARADLYKTSVGAWAIVQDKTRASAATLNERSGLIDVASLEYPMPPRAYELRFRPRAPGSSDWQFSVTRTGTGTAETMRLTNPYIYDGNVADRLIDYLAKRENGRCEARLKTWGAMFDSGDLITVTGYSCYTGNRDWIVRGVERPVDANAITARQYDASIYTYTAGTVPAASTNGYAPDYAQTPPGAPASVSYISGSSGTSVNTDGTVQAYALVRVTPPSPSVNWQTLIAVATNTSTNEVYRGVCALVSGNYEVVLPGLRPGRTHSLKAFAVNGTGVEGAVVTASNFTSAENTAAPSAVTSLSAEQNTTTSIRLTWTNPSIANFKDVRIERSTGGAYSTVAYADGNSWVDHNVSYGTTYTYKVYARDFSLNESSAATSSGVTPSANISDTHITSGGVSGLSIAAASINQGRQTTSTSTTTLDNIPANSAYNLSVPDFCYQIRAVQPDDDTARPLLWGPSNAHYSGYGTSGFALHNLSGVTSGSGNGSAATSITFRTLNS